MKFKYYPIIILIFILTLFSSYVISLIAHETTHIIMTHYGIEQEEPEYLCFALGYSETSAFISVQKILDKPEYNTDLLRYSWIKNIDFSKEEQIATKIGYIIGGISFIIIAVFVINLFVRYEMLNEFVDSLLENPMKERNL